MRAKRVRSADRACPAVSPGYGSAARRIGQLGSSTGIGIDTSCRWLSPGLPAAGVSPRSDRWMPRPLRSFVNGGGEIGCSPIGPVCRRSHRLVACGRHAGADPGIRGRRHLHTSTDIPDTSSSSQTSLIGLDRRIGPAVGGCAAAPVLGSRHSRGAARPGALRSDLIGGRGPAVGLSSA